MGTAYDTLLNSVKIYLERNGAKEFEGELNKVREIEKHLQALNYAMRYMEQAVNYKRPGVVAAQEVCETVVYGNYLPTKTEAAALTKIVNSMKIEKFPESIRPKGIEIKGYVDEITAQLKRVSNVINEIAKMVSSQS